MITFNHDNVFIRFWLNICLGKKKTDNQKTEIIKNIAINPNIIFV